MAYQTAPRKCVQWPSYAKQKWSYTASQDTANVRLSRHVNRRAAGPVIAAAMGSPPPSCRSLPRLLAGQPRGRSMRADQ